MNFVRLDYSGPNAYGLITMAKAQRRYRRVNSQMISGKNIDAEKEKRKIEFE